MGPGCSNLMVFPQKKSQDRILFMGKNQSPKYGYGFRTPYRFRTQSKDDVTTGYGLNFKIGYGIRYGYGKILKSMYGYGTDTD